ncbi:MAG: hypothetical protein AB2792_19810 [Candidatus Thiodiazotropha sp.]
MEDEIIEKIEQAILDVDNEAAPEQSSEKEQSEVTEETTTEEAQTEKTETVDDESSEDDESEETEEIPLDSNFIAEALGIEPELVVIDDEGIKFMPKVDGKRELVDPVELLKGYSGESHFIKKSTKLNEDRRVFEQERDAQMTELKSALGQATELLKLSEEGLIAEYNIDWNALRTENPAEFAAKRQEFQERYSQIQNAKAATQQQQQALTEQQLAELYQKESVALLDKIPTWSDESVAKQEMEGVNEYLLTMGYSKEEIASVLDHRAVAIARDAMLYRKQKSNIEIAKKKVVKKPKVMKPGKGKAQQNEKSEATKQKLSKLKKTGSTDDLTAVILDRI